MRILFLGDVMGRAGRRAIDEGLADLRAELGADLVIVNGENATNGMGLSGAHARGLLEAGADVVTLGDHAFDQRDMAQAIQNEPRILRPLNIAKGTAPGRGAALFEAAGKRVLVVQALGQVFMKQPYGDPFSAVDAALRTYSGQADAVVVEIHAEATSEKMGMGHFCDGRATLVVGTHTHVPTADAQILPGGTGYLTDAGMCGDYNSVIGMQKDEPLRRFITGTPKERFTPANGPATLCGVLVETDAKGQATQITPVRRGGRLQ